MNTETELAGLHILVTRPASQAAAICQQLGRMGAVVACLPVIEIAPPVAKDKARAALQEIDKYDNVIFVSCNAVLWAWRLLPTLAVSPWSQCRIGAIGQQTAAALAAHGLAVDDVPTQGFNSEQLLALSTMQAAEVRGRKLLIVRGQGGRTLLAQTLRQRGADVAAAEVYHRVCPSPAAAQALIQQQAFKPLDVIAITSCEGLHNLLHLLQSPAWLFTTPLLAGSQRIASVACQLGFNADVIVAANPSDHAMLSALSDWRQGIMHDR